MVELTLQGGTALTPDGWSDQPLIIRSGLVADVAGTGTAAQGGEVLDTTGLALVPGFIDLQINGGWGFDLQERPEDVWLLAERLPSIGVTSFLPTLTTNGFQHLDRAVAALIEGPPNSWMGAEPLGWHLEGPWLAPGKAGAHDVSSMRPTPAQTEALPFTNGQVRLVTLAPEMPGAIDLIGRLAGEGIAVSMGHTGASLEQVREGVRAGAGMGTHLFNAMDGLHHRRPGLAAALLLDDLFVGLIADGHHVMPDMVDLAWRLASERIVLVSDAIAGLGQTSVPVGRLADGTIAGAVVGLDQAVRNVMAFTGADLAAACRAAACTPARAIGLENRGTLQPGARADIVGLDNDHRVALTVIGGEITYRRV